MINNLDKNDLLAALLEEQTQMNEEIKAQAPAVYLPDLSSKLNYLVHLPRKILRRMLDKHLNKEDMRYLFGILSECDGDGVIRNITTYQLIKLVRAKYGIDNCSMPTLYCVHRRLEKLGFISMSERILTVIDYKESYRKGELGSVTLPSFIFNFGFKNVSVTAYRLMLHWMDLTGVIHYKRNDIYFKVNPDILNVLRKRCIEEIIPAINELKRFFNVTEKVNQQDLTPYYNISLKSQYIVAESELKGIKQAAHIKHERSCKYINKYILSHGIADQLLERSHKNNSKPGFEDLEVKDALSTIVKLLCTYTHNEIHRVLSILKSNLLKVRSIGAFIRQLINIQINKMTFDQLELKQLQRLMRTLIDNGLTEDDIETEMPDLYSKYLFLTDLCSVK